MLQDVTELVQFNVLKNVCGDHKVSLIWQHILANDARVEFRYLFCLELAELNEGFFEPTTTTTIVEDRLRAKLFREMRHRDPMVIARTTPTRLLITLSQQRPVFGRSNLID